MNIFVGITEIAGYHSAVATALRQRGHRVAYVMTKPKNPGYHDPENTGFPARITGWCQRLAEVRDRSLVHKIFWKVVTAAVRPLVLIWALFRCEAFVFGTVRSLLPWNLDLPLLKLFGKRILFICHGSDTRPTYLDFGGVLNPDGSRRPLAQVVRAIRGRKAAVGRMDRWADWIVDNPFSSHFHRRKLINWYTVGMPCELPAAAPAEPDGGRAALHAPSVPLVKGSARIAEAVAKVRERMPELRLVTVTGRPHAEVLDAIRNCHFVIDQLYSDTPCAGFVTEAAACGRPAIVGGYGWSEEWLRVSGLGEWPSLVCGEDDLEEAIAALAGDADLRSRTTEAARRRAAEWSREKVAERIEKILEGGAPEDWHFRPEDMPVFFSGGGLRLSVVREVIRDLVIQCGPNVLNLGDKPRLERQALELAGVADGLVPPPVEAAPQHL